MADSLAALREAKKRGVKTLGIVNVVGSSIAREADRVMYTWAGPEIAVATTKAYSAQLIAEYLLAIKFAQVRGQLTDAEIKSCLKDLQKLPEQIEMLLSNKGKIQHCQPLYFSEGCIFCRARRGLCNFHGGFPETEGDFLYSFRGICSRGIETWHNIAD